ncbi:acyltransferase family protein [Nocardioides sp. CFH 31398]|uniref:acyltransferase family protein n=1 Tax=Nocardioides sp. CFH 31398 TaxID=2919579 RepID=UPI001F05900F|nr:acyltransferase family protein [Nocardioides sp. CFH 31398]MCH1866475.1 acyltransferase [Nocardioides sp. CFH 31398]
MRFRPDIQGLRAVAVVLVALDHARVGPFSGGFVGVDVFFVVSGFLITGLLLAEIDRTGRLSLLDFYARRARRILPAACLVLVATSVACYLVLSGPDTIRVLGDVLWAAFFLANVKFAADETDYWAQDVGASPIQHFWSLAVEEQFYLGLPLLLLGLAVLARHLGTRRSLVPATIAVACVASFAYGVALTASDPLAAYFSTPARIWELGLGAGLAATAVHVRRLPAAVLGVAAWVGVAMIAVSALAYGDGTAFPGVPALLPVVGSVLVLAGGLRDVGWGAQSFLSWRPMGWIGDRSYSLYLWHWPALVVVAEVWRTPSGLSGLAVLAVALLLSDLTYRFVENPFRTGTFVAPRSRGLLLYPVTAALVAVTAWGVNAQVVAELNRPEPPVAVADYADEANLSERPEVALVQASVLAAEDARPVPQPLQPDPLSLVDRDEPVAADLGECEYFGMPEEMPLCPRGDPDGERTMVLLGDSHMRHWIPAIEPIAREQGYRAYFFVYQGCTPALVTPITPLKDQPDTDCDAFHTWSQEQIAELRPDLVFMSTDTQFEYLDEDGERTGDNREIAGLIEQGMVDRIDAVEPYAGRIVVIGDVPRLAFDPTVIAERGATLADGLSDPQPRSMLMRRAVRDAAQATGVDYVDPKRWFCAFDKCPVVVGDYLTRRDRGHMTLEYSESLTKPLARATDLR